MYTAVTDLRNFRIGFGVGSAGQRTMGMQRRSLKETAEVHDCEVLFQGPFAVVPAKARVQASGYSERGPSGKPEHHNLLDVAFRGGLAYVTGRICGWKAKPHIQTARKGFIQEQTRT